MCRAATDTPCSTPSNAAIPRPSTNSWPRAPNINAAAPDGATALAWAAFLDLPDMAVKLLDAGAKVNTAGDYGETPLTLALANGNAALSEKLLKAGAEPEGQRVERRDAADDRGRRG